MLLIWLFVLFFVGFTIWYCVEQWRSKPLNRGIWLADSIIGVILFTLFFFTWRWDYLGYYLRFIIPVLFLLIVVRSFFKVKHLPWGFSKTNWTDKFSMGFRVIIILFLSYFVISGVSGYYYTATAINLNYPLKNGTYYVAQGGNSTGLNYHNSHPSQAFALDILKLNRIGTRASGLTPKELDQYEIYGETIYSPCTGKVINVSDGIKELPPYQMNDKTLKYRTKNPAGNYVSIQCKDVQVIIAHMIPKSVKVKKGQQIKDGMAIGKVGNSGNSSEPHVHIHAEKNGKGVPIRFDEKFLTRNSLF